MEITNHRTMRIEDVYHPLGNTEYLDIILKDCNGKLWQGLLREIKDKIEDKKE